MIREWPLTGRSEELQLIAEATRATGDRARGIVLSGTAGVGKTRLATEAVAACGPRGAHRRWIVGTSSARSVPLGAFADIPSDFGPDPLRRVREVITGLVGDGHDGAVVVGIDDAHLLDDLSAFAVLQLVTRRLATVIMTVRSSESPPDAITTIWKDGYLQRLELQPLSTTETTRLAEHVLEGPVDSLSARRLWEYTQGNMLYLCHLLDNEIDAGRIARHSGVWLWDGQPTLSPTLTELLEKRIARVPPSVCEVLDALAAGEPLDFDILAEITDPDALAEAETLGLIRIDPSAQPAPARLAHPMLGEIRRTNSLRLQRLRGRIAAELSRKGGSDPRDLLRRAVLAMESDLPPDPALLTAAAEAAMQLLDSKLAETLSERAVAAGAGLNAKITQAIAITNQERATEAETILAELADQTSGMALTQITMFRATNFITLLGQLADAERVLTEGFPTDNEGARTLADSYRSVIDAVRGDSRAAVDRARALLGKSTTQKPAQLVSNWALVSALGDLGCIDDVESAANTAHRLAGRFAAASYLRLPLTTLEVNAYRLAGALTSADTTVTRMHQDTTDVPSHHSWHAFLVGMSAMSRGALAQAERALRECLAHLGSEGGGRLMNALARSWFATVTAMAGRPADARREFTTIEWWAKDVEARKWDPERSIAHAWTCAAEGATSQAISIMREAAQLERELGRPAWEVMLLQAATQFGDHTTGARLAELADIVQGPRAPAAASHATALAAGSGETLLEASRQYEAFGDRVAAADAAAQAVIVYRKAGRRGSSLSASTTAQRLADECQGARTPALRAAAGPSLFTERQREIIGLAAQGLSNKEIADRLTISVRSVEGHFLRASQNAGVNSREELAAILRGT